MLSLLNICVRFYICDLQETVSNIFKSYEWHASKVGQKTFTHCFRKMNVVAKTIFVTNL